MFGLDDYTRGLSPRSDWNRAWGHFRVIKSGWLAMKLRCRLSASGVNCVSPNHSTLFTRSTRYRKLTGRYLRARATMNIIQSLETRADYPSERSLHWRDYGTIASGRQAFGYPPNHVRTRHPKAAQINLFRLNCLRVPIYIKVWNFMLRARV